MAKVLKTAAIIVGAVALIVGTAGILAPAATAAALAAIGVTATAASIAAVAGAAATGLSLASTMVAKKPSALVGGNPEKFTANPDAGVPYGIGRTPRTMILRLRTSLA